MNEYIYISEFNSKFYLKFILNVDFMCTWCTCAKIVKIKKKKSGYSVSSSILLSEEVTKKNEQKNVFLEYLHI